jgi:hypothetical protein
MFGKWKWFVFLVAAQDWGTTGRLILLMAASFLFAGSAVGLVVVLIDHHAWHLLSTLLSHHAPP